MESQEAVLTAQRVDAVFRDCLFRGGEDASKAVVAEGIVDTFGFHPERLEAHRQEIVDMLAELPSKFKASGGGGYTFLDACMDRHGNQWTGLHATMEQLVCLGLATGQVEYCAPRADWRFLPGGVPYFVIK